MKIDNTSMFFNCKIKDGAATVAWGTSVGQSHVNGYKFNIRINGLSDIIIGMNYKIRTDSGNLDITKGSRNRELLFFSVFDKVYINNELLEDTSFILLLVKEHSVSHDGRIIISYPDYAIYNHNGLYIKNEDAMVKMAAKLNCSQGCWFVYDISIIDQDQLHFSAVVVDSSHKEYNTSPERRNHWNELVDSLNTNELPKIDFNYNKFHQDLKESGLIFSLSIIQRLIASLNVKPFVILTGLTGSGKTKLAQAFVKWICQSENQYRIIPVGADWTNREPLLGYPNALKPDEYIKPDSGVLDLILLAQRYPRFPHFLILDEMNLSHVERYFADFLSVMESNEEIPLYDKKNEIDGVPSKLEVPANLYIIGTVNIDETTNMFSPKVLDRANTIEFRVTKDEMRGFLDNVKEIDMTTLNGQGAGMAESFLDLSSKNSVALSDIEEIKAALNQFFDELRKIGAEFGYRSATEILRLIHQLSILEDTLSTNEKIDISIMQKLLPKLHGSRRKLCPVLETLGSLCLTEEKNIIKDVFEKENFEYKDAKYPLSLEKIARMYKGAIDNGYASFAEA